MNPVWPPVSAVGEATLLLHMLGVFTVQLLTPLLATVMSWKAAGELAAISYKCGFRLPCAVPSCSTSSAAMPPMVLPPVPVSSPSDPPLQVSPVAAKQKILPFWMEVPNATSGVYRPALAAGTPVPVCHAGVVM